MFGLNARVEELLVICPAVNRYTVGRNSVWMIKGVHVTAIYLLMMDQQGAKHVAVLCVS
jgi:hypothetical protein